MLSRVVLTALVFATMACIIMAKPTPSSTSVSSVSKPKSTHKVTVVSPKKISMTKKTDTKIKDNKTVASKKKGSKKSTSAKGIKKTSISSSKGRSTTRKFSSTTKVTIKASSASKRASSTTSALKASKTTASGYLTGGLPKNIFPDLSGYKLKKTDEMNDGLSYFKQQNDGVKLW